MMRGDYVPTDERLLTREQIEALTDLESLLALQDDVTAAAKQIEVDLEYRSDDAADESWEHRARKALTAHYVCNGHLTRRVAFLRRGGKPVKQGGDDAKARKKEAEAARLAAAAENKRAKAAHEREITVRMCLAYASRQSLLLHFQNAAKAHLDRATYARLMDVARADLEAMTVAELPAQGMSAFGRDPQGHEAKPASPVGSEADDAPTPSSTPLQGTTP
jgi:hypothetical protein